MATRKAPAAKPPEPHPELKIARADLEAKLAHRIGVGRELQERPIESEDALQEARQDYRTFDEYNATLLRRAFTTGEPADTYQSDSGGPFVVAGGTPPLRERAGRYRGEVGARLRRLESLVQQLPLFEPAASVALPPTRDSSAVGNGVFIVHGHNVALKELTARAVRKLTGDEPVILHEQPDLGRTIIEKFEDHADEMGFAVVLLSADETGGAKDGNQNPRARQNVVFELGYFFGKLGRRRVAVLYEPGVELPSDVNGVLYIEADSGGSWQFRLGRELRAAGLDADLNNLS